MAILKCIFYLIFRKSVYGFIAKEDFRPFVQSLETIDDSEKKMMKFRTPETKEPLYEGVYKVERVMTEISEVQVLHSSDEKLSEDLAKRIKELSFPLEHSGCTHWDKSVSVHILELAGKPLKYLYIRYFDQNQKIVAISILSEFLHIRLIEKIFSFLDDSKNVEILKAFSNPLFKHSYYEVTCESPISDYVVPYGLSGRSEIASLHQFFLANYPPSYAATIAAMIASDVRVLVVGSSTAKITQTILAIISLFYPVLNPAKVSSLIRNEDELSAFSGASIIGVHTTLLTKINRLIKPNDCIFNIDDPYLSCEAPPQFSLGVYAKIIDFHNAIMILTSSLKPAFPAKIVLRQTTGFLLSLIGVSYSINPRDINSVKARVDKMKESGEAPENKLAKSMFMKEFIEKCEKKEKEFALFYEEPVTDTGLIKKLGISGGTQLQKPTYAPKRAKTFLGIFNK